LEGADVQGHVMLRPYTSAVLHPAEVLPDQFECKLNLA